MNLCTYTRDMFRKNRRLRFFIAGVVCALLLLLLLLFVSPTNGIPLGAFHLPSLLFFFPLVFLTVYFLVITAFPSGFHGLLIAGFAIAYLLLRMNALTSPLLLVLLLLLLLILEIVLYKK